jgi:hypothetical protein
MKWVGGRVTVEDSVASSRKVTGRDLREDYFREMTRLTFGLLRQKGSALTLGPLEIIRFGSPKTARTAVELPIEGGLAVRAPGGHLRIAAAKGRITASVEGYRPRLPLPVYMLIQLPIHHIVLRLYLLSERGRLPTPGVPAPPTRRAAAAAIDAGVCVAAALVAGKGRRLPALVGITAGYHIACWTISGRTIGGALTRQRVVAVDGSRVSIGQAVIRLLALPFAVARVRALHDEIAGTEVISD